jgi:hypothetical protein
MHRRVAFLLFALATSGASLAAGPTRLKITGALDPRVVETIVATHQGQVNDCGALHPSAQGTLVLHWTVKEDGTVSETCQTAGTTVPQELGRCVSDRVTGWTFPSPGFAQKADVEYVFQFSAR